MKTVPHNLKFAPLFAKLLVEEYWKRDALDRKLTYPVHAVHYHMFMRMEAQTSPGARGFCYHLALQQLPPRG